MPAQIRPNRLSVSDRFPMLGFTIRTEGGPRRAEVTLATDPALFASPEGRTAENFYSTREKGALRLEGDTAAYVVPTEVLARFVGAERLYFGLATAPAENGALVVDVQPDEASPYISISGLSGRGLRRVRMFPSQSARGGEGYANGHTRLQWAGDAPAPGMERAAAPKPANGANGANGAGSGGNGASAPSGAAAQSGAAAPARENGGAGNGGVGNGATGNGSADAGAPATEIEYDDGFGELPALPAEGSGPAAEMPAQAQALARAMDAGTVRMGDQQPATAPEVHRLGFWESTGVQALLAANPMLTGPIAAARALVEAMDVSVAIGPAVSGGGFGQGAGAAFGLIFAPGNVVGAYGTIEINTGTLADISGTLQITILKGGIDSFRGISATAGFIAGAEGFVGGASAIFNDRGEWLGVTVEGGIGLVPTVIEFFGSVQRTIAVEFGHAAAFAVNGPTVQALTSGEIELGERAPFTAPDVTTLGWAASTAVQAALAANPAFTAIVAAARAASEAGDVSIGIGPAVSGGLGAGAQLGVGIIFAPGNTIGAYGSADLLVGAIASVSLTVQVTIVRGGISNFGGMAMTAGFSAGEGIVGGGAVIFDAQGEFLGVSFQIGIGAGLSPLEVYASIQRGVARQLGTAVAFGHAGPPAWAQVIGPDDVQEAQRYAPAWEDLFNWQVPAAVSSAVTGRGSGFEVMPISAAHGSLNLDRYEVRCDRLPSGMSAAQLLNRFRLNINDFVDTRNSEFEPYASSDGAKWSGSNPVGALFYIDIAGPDNASVVGSMVESNRFRFTTIKAPRSGEHPVSGHREFGFRAEGGGHVFYTRGADRATDGIAETIVFAGGDHLWKSFQTKMAAFINDNGGSATILPRFSERFHPDVVRILYPAGAAQALGGFDPYAVEVKYRMFIPSPVVEGPPLHDDFGGDGRGFSYSSGSSRGEIVATVNLSTGLGIDSIDVTRRVWGESTSYDSDDTVAVSGKPDWWRDKAPGASVKSRDTLRATPDNLDIVPGTGGQRGVRVYAEGASAVTIHAEGANPLVTLSPDIDVDLSVLFRNNNGLIQAMALGNHDGFPAHELYVNGELIYSYDPVAAGNGPMSLVGTSDIDVDTGWKTVARINIVRTGGQTLGQARAMEFNESFTINWDEVQQIAQPTDMSCWATAAAMVIGWRDRMSLSPQTIAEIGGRSIVDGLDPSKVEDFANDMGLVFEYPQSYTKQGFRALLEQNGPLWIGTAPSGLHVVVVTGLYNEGQQMFVRITDPWDRVVGAPGAPGPALSTHQQGSRYIMRWEDFVAEYERAATDFSSVNLQILHSGGTDGRLPNMGERVTPGYAQALKSAEPKDTATAAPPSAAPLTVSLSGVVAQVAAPLTESANAVGEEPAAAWRALVEGFDPALGESLSGLPGLAARNGWTVAVGREDAGGAIGAGIGVTADLSRFRYRPADAPAAAASANGAALMVTVLEGGVEGLTGFAQARSFTASDGTSGALLLSATGLPMGIAMRLQPGADLPQRIEAVAAAVRTAHAAAGDAPATTTPPAPAAPAATPAPAAAPGNGTSAPHAGAPASEPAVAAAGLSTPPAPAVTAAPEFPPPGTRLLRSTSELAGVSYDMFLLDGPVPPQMPAAVAADPVPAPQVVISEWPYIDGPSGRSFGAVAIDWSTAAGTVANVRTTPTGEGAALDGWRVKVHADIGPGPSTPTETRLKVILTTTFERDGEAPQTGVTEVVLTGSGSHDINYREEPAQAPVAG